LGDSILRTSENAWQNFSKQLSNDFASQYNNQSAIYAGLTSTLTNEMNNPHGFSPATLSALRGGTTDNIATQFNNARQNIQAGQAANGSFGGDVKSGVAAQISGQLAGQQASAEASGLDTIEQQDAQLKQSNFWNAEQGLQGVAAGEDPTAIAKQANSAAAETGQLGSEYFQTDQSGFGDMLGKSFANGLGNVLSGNAILGGSGLSRMLGSTGAVPSTSQASAGSAPSSFGGGS
jgi:hypothetical protein